MAATALAAFLLSGVLSALAQGVGGVAYADSGNFTLDTTGLPPGGGGVGYGDSGNFTLDTTGLPPGGGGVGYGDSGNFTLDTTGLPPGGGGVGYGDSGNFTLDTTGLPSGGGGVGYGDSGNFTLDTTGLPSGGGGVGYADSGTFALDTTGLPAGGGGVAYADSANFTLDTTGLPVGGGGVAYADSGNFTVDTTGLPSGGGGGGYGDSGNFTLDTTGTPPGVARYVWTNAAGGKWSVAANWSPNHVPGANDAAYITTNGNYTVTVDVAASVTNLTLGASSGTQALNLSSGAFTLGGPGSGNGQAVVSISGGTLAGSGMLTLAGPLNWIGGTIKSVVQFNGGTFSGSYDYLDGGQLINLGTLAWNPLAVVYDGLGSVISNAPGATINITETGNDNITGNGYGPPQSFYNAGQLNVSAGSGSAIIADTFVNSGTLNLQGGGSNTSTILVTASTAGLHVSIGTFTFNTGSTLTDAGNLILSGGTVNVAGTVSVAGTNTFSGATVNVTGSGAITPAVMTMSGGTLSGNRVTVSGPLNWSGGTIKNVVQFNGGTFSGSGLLNGGQLINLGTLAWSSGVYDGAGSVISNAPGATINLTGSGSITLNEYGAPQTFYNAGQLNVSAGSGGTATVSDSFVNSGTVSVNSGTLDFQGIYSQTAGLTLLNGGNINNTYGLEIQGGTLAGSGTVSGSVTNSGTVSPGSPLGHLAIGGTYVQTANGTLDIALGGTTPGTGFSWLTVSNNTAFLAGTLNVTFTNGFYPAANASFTYLNAHTRSNVFANFIYPTSLVVMTNIYASNSASLLVLYDVSQAVPPLSITFVQPDSVVVSWPNTGSYTLQTNNNLSTANWSAYGGTVILSNGTNSLTITPPVGDLFFRLRQP